MLFFLFLVYPCYILQKYDDTEYSYCQYFSKDSFLGVCFTTCFPFGVFLFFFSFYLFYFFVVPSFFSSSMVCLAICLFGSFYDLFGFVLICLAHYCYEKCMTTINNNSRKSTKGRYRLFFLRVFRENSPIAGNHFTFCWFFSSAKHLQHIFANCRRKTDKAEHRASARYEPCAPRIPRVSPLPTVRDRRGSSPASFPGYGRRKRHASRELSLSVDSADSPT